METLLDLLPWIALALYADRRRPTTSLLMQLRMLLVRPKTDP